MELLKHIEIDGNPSTVTAQQDGIRVVNGVAIHYIKPEVSKAKRELWLQLAPHKPEKPFTGSLCLRVIWRFSRKSWTYKTQRTSYKDTRPDLDNLVKGLADVMTGTFWEDDNQLSRLELSKIWNEKGGLLIEIYRLTPEDYENEINTFDEVKK